MHGRRWSQRIAQGQLLMVTTSSSCGPVLLYLCWEPFSWLALRAIPRSFPFVAVHVAQPRGRRKVEIEPRALVACQEIMATTAAQSMSTVAGSGTGANAT